MNKNDKNETSFRSVILTMLHILYNIGIYS